MIITYFHLIFIFSIISIFILFNEYVVFIFILSIIIKYYKNKVKEAMIEKEYPQRLFIKYIVLKNFNLYIDFIYDCNLIIEIPNIYLFNKKSKLLWIDYKKDLFTKYNWPNTISWDYKIKVDILEKSLKLNKNEAIIDCGAHIGDMTIPIAHALKVNNRSDVIVYAIDPSPEKCKYIEFLADINNLTNVKVICCGLSSKKCKLYPQIPNNLNTGATVWINKIINPFENSNLYHNDALGIFETLDNLIETKQINHNIKIIHLDVEGHEKEVIIGACKTIKKYNPYISLETHSDERGSFEKILKNNYKFIKRINQNNIFYTKKNKIYCS